LHSKCSKFSARLAFPTRSKCPPRCTHGFPANAHPPGLGLSSPQPDPNRPRPRAAAPALMSNDTALQVLQMQPNSHRTRATIGRTHSCTCCSHTQLGAPVHDHEHVARAPLSTIRLYVRPLTHSGAALRTSVTGDVRSARKETTERCASERDYGTTMIHTGGSESRGSRASTSRAPTASRHRGRPPARPGPHASA